MDQEPLVREEIDAARKFLDELGKRLPFAAAFWLKPEEGPWSLYVAADRVSREGMGPVYDVAGEAAAAIDDPNFDLFRVKLIGARHPLAKAAREFYRRRPSEIPVYIRDGSFGGMGVDGVYLYPPMAAALNPIR